MTFELGLVSLSGWVRQREDSSWSDWGVASGTRVQGPQEMEEKTVASKNHRRLSGTENGEKLGNTYKANEMTAWCGSRAGAIESHQRRGWGSVLWAGGGGRHTWQRAVAASLGIQLSSRPQLFREAHCTFWQPLVVEQLDFWISHCMSYTSWRFCVWKRWFKPSCWSDWTTFDTEFTD